VGRSVQADNDIEEPPSQVELRLSDDAAAMLDLHCKLDFAKSREEMSRIWIVRWSKYDSFGPSLGAVDESGNVTGHAPVKILETYQRAPVALPVEIDEVTRGVLRERAVRARVLIEHLASAIINEHSTHMAVDLRRNEAGLGFIPVVRTPCWCGDGPTGGQRGS